MAAQTHVVHRALDGARFALRSSLPLQGLATSTVDLVHAGSMRQLHAGVRGLGADMAAAAGLDGFDEQLSYRSATLRVGRTTITDPRDPARSAALLLGAWLGRQHSLVAHLYNASTSGLLELLGSLDIAEHPDGITAIPGKGGGTTYRAPAAVLKPVEGLGLLEIRRLTRQDAADLPTWRGADAGSGELFRDTLSNGAPYFLLVTDGVRVTVLPQGGTDPDSVPDLLHRLRIELVT